MSMSSNSDRRYNLTFGVSVRNVFNNVNVANPNAVLGSPLFGSRILCREARSPRVLRRTGVSICKPHSVSDRCTLLALSRIGQYRLS